MALNGKKETKAKCTERNTNERAPRHPKNENSAGDQSAKNPVEAPKHNNGTPPCLTNQEQDRKSHQNTPQTKKGKRLQKQKTRIPLSNTARLKRRNRTPPPAPPPRVPTPPPSPPRQSRPSRLTPPPHPPTQTGSEDHEQPGTEKPPATSDKPKGSASKYHRATQTHSNQSAQRKQFGPVVDGPLPTGADRPRIHRIQSKGMARCFT